MDEYGAYKAQRRGDNVDRCLIFKKIVFGDHLVKDMVACNRKGISKRLKNIIRIQFNSNRALLEQSAVRALNIEEPPTESQSNIISNSNQPLDCPWGCPRIYVYWVRNKMQGLDSRGYYVSVT